MYDANGLHTTIRLFVDDTAMSIDCYRDHDGGWVAHMFRYGDALTQADRTDVRGESKTEVIAKALAVVAAFAGDGD